MSNSLIKEGLLWGIVLWLFGYTLGILLFPIVPTTIMGWIIMPIGIIFTIWILTHKIKKHSLTQYIILGFIWFLIAIILDYFFLVKVFHPADGYYKMDVYLYYAFTFLVPTFFWLQNNLYKNK